MKYKLIKNFPGYPYKGVIMETISPENKGLKENPALFSPSHWPEYFELVKEPLFVSEDGVEIYEDSDVVGVSIQYYNIEEEFNIQDRGVDIVKLRKEGAVSKYFSTREAAEKWIKKNKPKFSEQQILDTICKCYHVCKDSSNYKGYYTDRDSLNIINFKIELGI
jgi:hypothetical protein